MKFVLLALNLTLVIQQAIGQEAKYDFESYGIKEGLSHNLVQSIAQDKRGFMWFGTEDGLNRFDGHEFKVYRHKENDPTTIVSNSIRVLFIDDDNSIWIGTDNGICRLFPETEYIQHYPIDFTDETKLNGSHVSSIKKHKDGSIWISYIGSGIDIIHPGRTEIFHYTIHRNDQYQLKSDMISALQFMPDGYTIIGTYSGLQFLDKEGNVMTAAQASEKFPWTEISELSIKTLLLSNDGLTLWIGTEVNGVYKIDLTLNSIQNFNTLNSEITSADILSISEDSRGNTWIGSDALYLYDPRQNTLVWFNALGMYVKNHTYSIFDDKDHNMWVGTSRLGIRKFNNYNKRIRHFHTNQGAGSLKSNEVLSFNEDPQGNIWVGTGGAGLARMHRDLSGFEEAEINTKLYSQVIKKIHRDREGNFWMGGWDAGLIRYNPGLNSLEQFHPNNGRFNSRHIWDIAEDVHGNFWLATLRDGLCRYEPSTKKFTYFKNDPNDPTSLANDDVLGVHIDKNNVLWVATSNGLSVLLPGSESFTNSLKFKTNNQNALSNSVLLCLQEDQQGRIWLGSKGGGITIVRLVKDKIIVEHQLKESDGLPSNNITALETDLHHNIWASTSAGLARIIQKDENNFEITPVLELQGTEFLEQSAFKAIDGSLLFGGSNGFYIFHPDSLDLSPQHVEVLLTQLKIINDEITPNTLYRDRKVIDKSITELDDITLSHEDYAFTISFASVTFNQQKSIQYAYMLENLDKEWQYTSSSRRFVHYTNLSPGTYHLRIKASYDGKNWLTEAKTLTIHVDPPWWATFWFRLGFAIVVGGIVYSIYQGRVRFLDKQRIKLEKLVVLRTRELRRSHDEIRTLLEEVAQQKDNIVYKNQELQQINEALGTQRDTLEAKSSELEKAQGKLREINASLELLVDKRTQKLNDTLQELETFLYRASHDLRGPIASMLGLLEIAKMDDGSGVSNPIYITYFNAAVHRLERSLQKLLQKYILQKEEPSYEYISVEEVVKLVHELTEDIKAFRPTDFEIAITDSLKLHTDRKFLTIVLLSLLENAFFYSEHSSNKKVSLEVKQSQQGVCIIVTDWGLGIKEEQIDKVFTMFYRGSILSTGNGLGLYLVKSAVEKLKGSIELETAEGKFTRFTVVLDNPEIVPNPRDALDIAVR